MAFLFGGDGARGVGMQPHAALGHHLGQFLGILDQLRQILGQLAERLNYDKLYQEAISDPELKRTKVELEAALSNASEAREVVFELFQDLEGFSLDDYKPFSDVSSSLDRLVRFLSVAVVDRQQRLVKIDEEGLF